MEAGAGIVRLQKEVLPRVILGPGEFIVHVSKPLLVLEFRIPYLSGRMEARRQKIWGILWAQVGGSGKGEVGKLERYGAWGMNITSMWEGEMRSGPGE